MKVELAYYGNPILRKKCEPVSEITDEIRTLVRDMVDTLKAENGLGLAAPQVKHALRLFITAVPVEEVDGEFQPGPLRVFINPNILEVSEEQAIETEGCLSIPKVRGHVERPIRIRIRATNLDGEEFEEEFTDLQARCILHENDHINGVLYVDRIRGKERKELDPFLQKIKKQYAE